MEISETFMENFWNKWKKRYYIVQYCILL
jgi:hypothetical protein